MLHAEIWNNFGSQRIDEISYRGHGLKNTHSPYSHLIPQILIHSKSRKDCKDSVSSFFPSSQTFFAILLGIVASLCSVSGSFIL